MTHSLRSGLKMYNIRVLISCPLGTDVAASAKSWAKLLPININFALGFFAP